MTVQSYVWVFLGANSIFPGAVFSSKEKAEEWIKTYSLTGVLTMYPVDQSVYDWAITKGYFKAKKEHETSSQFIQSFSSASQDHFHYENGELD